MDVEVDKLEEELADNETGCFRPRDSTVGGVPVVYGPDDDHMEEEVQVSVQVEEEEIGETHGEEQSKEQRVKERTTAQHG